MAILYEFQIINALHILDNLPLPIPGSPSLSLFIMAIFLYPLPTIPPNAQLKKTPPLPFAGNHRLPFIDNLPLLLNNPPLPLPGVPYPLL